MKRHKVGGGFKKGRELSRKYWMRCGCLGCSILRNILQYKYRIKKGNIEIN